MSFLFGVILFLGVLHVSFLTLFLTGLYRLSKNRGRSDKKPFVSIIVPARNEVDNLDPCLDSLVRQDYPPDLMEIVVVDDESDDGTDEICKRYATDIDYVIALRSGPWEEGLPLSPKKRAIQRGIEVSSGEIILTCDADCIAPVGWISSMVRHFEDDVVMVAGYTGIDKPADGQRFFIKLQSLEMLSMLTCAAGSLSVGWHLASSGSNQAFRKKAFIEAGGYGKIGNLVSGDDDLLLQKLSKTSGSRIVFNREPESFMATEPVPDLKAYYLQRKRWGAKYTYYRKSYQLFLTQYYLLVLAVFLLPFSLILEPGLYPLLLVAIVLKTVPEYTLLFAGTALFKRKDLRKYLPAWSLFQVPYIAIMGPTSLFTKITWKGRQYGSRSRISVPTPREEKREEVFSR